MNTELPPELSYLKEGEEVSQGKTVWTAVLAVFFAHVVACVVSFGLVYNPEDYAVYGKEGMVSAIDGVASILSAVINLSLCIALAVTSKAKGEQKLKVILVYALAAGIEYIVLFWATGPFLSFIIE